MFWVYCIIYIPWTDLKVQEVHHTQSYIGHLGTLKYSSKVNCCNYWSVWNASSSVLITKTPSFTLRPSSHWILNCLCYLLSGQFSISSRNDIALKQKKNKSNFVKIRWIEPQVNTKFLLIEASRMNRPQVLWRSFESCNLFKLLKVSLRSKDIDTFDDILIPSVIMMYKNVRMKLQIRNFIGYRKCLYFPQISFSFPIDKKSKLTQSKLNIKRKLLHFECDQKNADKQKTYWLGIEKFARKL